MDINEDQSDESIPDGAILMTANNILNLLEYSEQLTNEEDLFSDEFYISILSNLLSEQKFDIKPGETPEEKVKSLKKLIKLLSEIIEMDLSQISPEGIIIEHDKISAKSFLDLIEELIKTLMNANLGEEENENETKNGGTKIGKEENKNESNSEINDDNFVKPNNSEGNIFGGNKNKFNLDDNEGEVEVENENEDYFNMNKKGSDEYEEINRNELKKGRQSTEKSLNKSDKKSENNKSKNDNEDIVNNINNTSNEEMKKSIESIRRLNHSNIEQLELEKMFKNLENKNEESYIRKTYSQNDLSSYEKQLAEREDENENEEGNMEENEQSLKKSKNDENENVKKDMLSSPEDGENKFPEGALDLNYNLEDKNLSGGPIMNVSHISELSQDKKENEIKESSGKKSKKSEKSDKKFSYEYKEENSDLNKSIKDLETQSDKIEKNIENSSKKKNEDDLPDLYLDRNQKSKKSKKIEYDEEEEEDEEKIKKKFHNNYFDSNEDESNLEGEGEEEENIYIPNSVSRVFNRLHLPSSSKETESSRQSKNKRIINKESNSSLTNSNISFHSKNSKKSSNNKNNIDYNDISKSSSNKKNQNINANKKSSTKRKDDRTSTSKKQESFTDNKSQRSKRSQRQIEENENEESVSNISKSSVYSNAHEKSAKSSASKKSGISKKNKSFTNSEKNKDLTSSQKNKKYNIKDILSVEIPMTDKEIKYEIMKELKRLYGEKAKKYFNKNFLELIIENIKLARKTILKMETGVEPDDNFSKEFMLKYQKEIQKILKYYIDERNKEKNYKQNAIISLGQNIKFIKKLKEAEFKDVLNDIENKKKERELQSEEEQNQIILYPSYCYELQKQIYIAQTQNQIDLNNAIIEEKKKMIEESEKAYSDRIAIMYELLRREKRERINQKKLNESLENELKKMNKKKLKMQVEDMLNQIEEEDRKMDEADANNQEEIEKILHNFC